MMRWLRIGLPLAILIALSIFLARGLQLDPRHLPSAQLGKPAPAFTLQTLAVGTPLSTESLRGQVWIMNVFASWCSACIIEHPRLLKLAAAKKITMIGLAYKDNPEDTQRWLADNGNPYQQVALDLDGRTGINYGVYGVPETYVIDANGIIRYRHVGPVDDDFFDVHVLPLMPTTPIPLAKP